MYDFKDYKDAYNESKNYQQKGVVASFPPYVTLELSTLCNYKCLICHLSYSDKKNIQLPMLIFKKTIDEIARNGSMVRLIGYCEPLLYGGIKEAVRYIKEKGLLLHITTNGSVLNKDMVRMLVEANVDSIIISMQGLTEKEYCFMRSSTKATYRKVIKNITALYKARNKSLKPFIKITTTISERDSKSNKSRFLKKHLRYADEVQISGYTTLMHLEAAFGVKNVWKTLQMSKPSKIGSVSCFNPNYEMLIKANGDVHACCGAYAKSLRIGNVQRESLANIWNSNRAKKIRHLLWSAKLDNIKECSVCSIRYEYKDIGSTVTNNYNGSAVSLKK